MTCTCGDVMTVDTANQDEAVEKLKTMMNEEMIAKHMAEKHPNEPIPSVDQVHMMIDQGTKESAEPIQT